MHKIFILSALTALSVGVSSTFAQSSPPAGGPEVHKARVEAALKDCASTTKMKEDSPEFSKCMMGKGFMKPAGTPAAGPNAPSMVSRPSPMISTPPSDPTASATTPDGKKPLIVAPLSVTSVAPGAKPDK